MTGYQEILTDPSYAGQIITFTFPHIGNVGTNLEDIETITPAARGAGAARRHHRAGQLPRDARPLDDWLKAHNLAGICGVDTRALTRRIRDGGAPNGVVAMRRTAGSTWPPCTPRPTAWPGLEGMDLALEVT